MLSGLTSLRQLTISPMWDRFVVAIMVLSLVPGSLRPHTGLPGQMEHALAYGLTGALLCVGFGKPRDSLLLWIGLAGYSALFELLQNFVPGRSPAVIDSLPALLA
jgi:VanZ family protein